MAVVVDTNVPVVANNASPNASLQCALKCVQMLKRITLGAEGYIAIDNAGMILKEYQRHLIPFTGQSPGDVFCAWLFNHQYDPTVCERVEIPLNANSNDPNDFVAFPNTPALSAFDPSDKKFVCVALNSQYQPGIINAVDSDWWIFREPLKQCGVELVFLCPDAMPE